MGLFAGLAGQKAQLVCCNRGVGNALSFSPSLPARAQVHLDKKQARPVECAAASVAAQPAAPAPAATFPTLAARQAAFTEDILPEQENLELHVEGQLPAWLCGAFVRNGPGTYKGMRHLFDGYAMLVSFSMEGGRVHVTQRYVESEAWKGFRDTGRMEFAEYGTPLLLARGIPKLLAGVTGLGQGFTDNASVNVLPGAARGELVAVTESVAGTFRIDERTLRTLGRVKYSDGIKGDLNTAHPTLQRDGSIINLAIGFGTDMTLYRQAAAGAPREVLARIPLSKWPTPSWIHDFPVTPNYAVIPEQPCFFNIKAAVAGGAEYVMFDWCPERRTRLHLVPLAGGAVRTFDAPAYFTFHYLNAFESADGRSLCFDFPWFEDPIMLNNLYLDVMRSNGSTICSSPLRRITLPLDGSSTEARVESLMRDDASYIFAEMPRVNPKVKGLEYRFAYGLAAKPPCAFGNGLAKFDVVAGEATLWHEPGCIPGEPVMVPRPGAQDEDDGVVLSVVVGADGRSFLLALDARGFTEVARAQLPYGVPYGFHCAFTPRDPGGPAAMGKT
ncbi:hypothetical protein WJX81_008489 [Elliptochloris bilobata]|uniref:Uncharacterized protein n=1 Tax=Elliptochloris bilobata TaxID=381761 RepID=A0AAW1RCX9_9CHLO